MLARRNILPTHIQANAAGPGGLAQQTPASFVAGLGPRIERPIGERAQRIRHDQRLVVLQHRTEAIAPGTRAARIIEGKERRREHGRGAAAGRAGRVLGKAPTVAVVQRDGNAFAFAERRGNGVSQPTAILLGGLDAVHKNQNVFAGADSLLGVGVVQPYRLAVDLCAHKTGGPELRSDLNVRTVSGRRQWERDDNGIRRTPHAPRVTHRIHHLLHRIPFHVPATLEARLRPGTGPQQSQEIIDFGGGPDGRTARGRGVLLFDRDGR